ncbi:MAG TPA: response regulator transcription factor [Ferrovibrio sp.]|uniref:LuxR family transcriptional regulator n=1 Tax=Ferrovibrio sp. TaxID=1917215 RepID=UPI002B4B33A5|nr:response regulator transcription factor [Ferrovibrio sp.]HLT77320.1 response regulator transcription factor [Ferrovibrio sp.]
MSNNPIRFVDEQYPDSHRGQPGEDRTSWKVLIVDDEPDVHSLTKLLLRNFRYRDRGLEYLSAFSAAEAQDLLREHPDIALVLLDVVMETEHAGLALVDYIRNELGNRSVQIVIRTGQAGQAPPLTVISNHGINDYREKTDLTQQTMILTVVKALRLYEDFLPSYVAAAKFANLAERARAGADDRELLRCLRQELEQSAPELPPARAPAEEPDPRLAALTDREREVLKWVSQGDSNKAIALRLGVQEVTVKAHLRQIFSKLQVFNRTQAASLALRLLERDVELTGR